MKIVFISDWFSEKMGYAENLLTKAMASLGYEVHVITSNVQPYFDSPFYKDTYEPFIGPAIQPCGTKEFDGYVLHRLPYEKMRKRLRIKGLFAKLRELQPDIVQTFDIHCLSTYESALAQPVLGYKLFLESHVHASVFPYINHKMGWKKFLRQTAWFSLGRVVSLVSQSCYPISIDAAEIVVEFFGIPNKKVRICPLGTDTFLFQSPNETSQKLRLQKRSQFGFTEEDIVCIYTGRFTDDKNPLCLARAIDTLTTQYGNYRGLFVGNGPQEQEIREQKGCNVHPFVPVNELPALYYAADIGVWPSQESTSQLDAAACGLPLIVSNRVTVRERVEGNGLFYEEGNFTDLAYKIRALSHPNIRRYLGNQGSQKVTEEYSWVSIAQQRVQDYRVSLK